MTETLNGTTWLTMDPSIKSAVITSCAQTEMMMPPYGVLDLLKTVSITPMKNGRVITPVIGTMEPLVVVIVDHASLLTICKMLLKVMSTRPTSSMTWTLSGVKWQGILGIQSAPTKNAQLKPMKLSTMN